MSQSAQSEPGGYVIMKRRDFSQKYRGFCCRSIGFGLRAGLHHPKELLAANPRIKVGLPR